MARTRLADQLRESASVARESFERGVGVDEVLEERRTRKELLRDAGILALGLGALGRFTDTARAAAASARVVVVGAGLAGLTAAYRLRQAGCIAAVHEGSDRVGGRCWSIRGVFADGQIGEHGGELIDQGHTELRHLAQELGLQLDNLLQGELNGSEPAYYFDGSPYPVRQATPRPPGHLVESFHSDLSAASYPTLHDSYTQRGYASSTHMSIVDWINESVPGGINSRLGQLLDVAYNIEYGAASSEQQLAEPDLISSATRDRATCGSSATSNEKYHVRGGNDQVAPRLAERALAGQITLGSELIAIRLNTYGTYTLTFRQGKQLEPNGHRRPRRARRPVLDPSRSTVDISHAGFSPLKRTAISELGMGTQLQAARVQFRDAPLADASTRNGETYADRGYQNTWEVTPGPSWDLRASSSTTRAATIGASFGTGTPQQRAQQFLAQIEPVLPGLSAPVERPRDARLLERRIRGRGAPTRTGRSGQYTRFSGARARARRETASSAASTRRSTPRAI